MLHFVPITEEEIYVIESFSILSADGEGRKKGKRTSSLGRRSQTAVSSLAAVK